MEKQKRDNILVVDDEPGMREFLTAALSDGGYKVISAASATQALTLIDQHSTKTDEKISVNIALTLLDIQMPSPGGMEVLRYLRDVDPDAVVILITAYASLETAIQALRYGAYDYLGKPLPDINTLLTVVQRGIDKRRLLINNQRLLSQLRRAYQENLRLLEEMQSLNQTLEARVGERTRRLEIANRRLRELDRLKSELLANVSHELYTPLNVIMGFSQVLLEGLHGPLADEQARLIENILSSGQRLKGSFDDLIDMARLSANEVLIYPKLVPLNPLITSVKVLIERSAQEKEIDFIVEAAPGIENVWADETKLKRMLYELLNNAIKFTSQGGKVTLRAFKHPAQQPTELHLEVSDTGIGIPADELKGIFDPFQQVDSSLARRFGGLGLGLAVVRHYAELHGGRIWVESQAGIGSTFTLALPLLSSS